MASLPTAGDVARKDIPVCHLTDRIGDVRDRVRTAGWNVCVVVNDERVVLGLLRGKALDSDPQAVVEQAMDSGPTTIRPNLSLEESIEYMKKNSMDSVLPTTSDGWLVGILHREDAERQMKNFQAATGGGA